MSRPQLTATVTARAQSEPVHRPIYSFAFLTPAKAARRLLMVFMRLYLLWPQLYHDRSTDTLVSDGVPARGSGRCAKEIGAQDEHSTVGGCASSLSEKMGNGEL